MEAVATFQALKVQVEQEGVFFSQPIALSERVAAVAKESTEVVDGAEAKQKPEDGLYDPGWVSVVGKHFSVDSADSRQLPVGLFGDIVDIDSDGDARAPSTTMQIRGVGLSILASRTAPLSFSGLADRTVVGGLVGSQATLHSSPAAIVRTTTFMAASYFVKIAVVAVASPSACSAGRWQLPFGRHCHLPVPSSAALLVKPLSTGGVASAF